MTRACHKPFTSPSKPLTTVPGKSPAPNGQSRPSLCCIAATRIRRGPPKQNTGIEDKATEPRPRERFHLLTGLDALTKPPPTTSVPYCFARTRARTHHFFLPPITRLACGQYSRCAQQYPRTAPQAPESRTLAHRGNPTTVYRTAATPARPPVCCAGCSPTPSPRTGMSTPHAAPLRFPALTHRPLSSARQSLQFILHLEVELKIKGFNNREILKVCNCDRRHAQFFILVLSATHCSSSC